MFYYSYSDTTNEPRSEAVTDPLAILLEARFEPCQVCGEQSSGLHCGAITCEACKVRKKIEIFISKNCIVFRNFFFDQLMVKI